MSSANVDSQHFQEFGAAVDQTVNSVGLLSPGTPSTGITTCCSWAISKSRRHSSHGPSTTARPPCGLPQSTNLMANWWASNSSMFQQLVNTIRARNELFNGVHTVTPNPERKLFDQLGFMQAHLASPATPGPVGHGFLNATSSRDKPGGKPMCRHGFASSDWIRATVTGADGAVPQDQFDWLKTELTRAQAENKIAIVCSHHNSYTFRKCRATGDRPDPESHHADEFVAMLQGFPNLVASVNGHTISTPSPRIPGPEAVGSGDHHCIVRRLPTATAGHRGWSITATARCRSSRRF